jgi:hypothetical protein
MSTSQGDNGMTEHTAPPAFITANPNPATEKQVAFIKRLAEQKDLGEHAEYVNVRIALADEGKMDKGYASRLIERLLALPKLAVAPKPVEERRDIVSEQSLWVVPPGRYALVNDKASEEDTNPILFYRVSRGKPGGKWEGKLFLARIVGGNSDMPIRPGAQATAIIKAIHGDVLGAAQRYGKEIGQCSICNRHLTQRLSRELGIGPKCAERIGMPREHIDAAKHVLIAQGYDPKEVIA